MMWAQHTHTTHEGESMGTDQASAVDALLPDTSTLGAADTVFLPHGAFETTLADTLASPELTTALSVLPALLAFGLVSGGVYAWWRHTIKRQYQRTWLEMQTRTWLGLWPGPGFAGWRTLNREYGRRRPRKIAKHIRPSLTWRDRWLGDPREYSVLHGYAHRAWAGLRHPVRSSFQDNTLVLGPAQEGKSAAAAFYAWDAPGPLLTTTIRADLLEATGAYRATLGDLHVFNPANVGIIGSTFRWNVVDGCQDYAVATRRAYAIVYATSGDGLKDASFWKNQAATALSAYMHAAALIMATPQEAAGFESGAQMEYIDAPVTLQTVMDWIAAVDLEPYALLREHPGANRGAASALLELFQAPLNTRGSVLKTLGESLRFMSDSGVVEALTPHPSFPAFDIEAFLRSKDSLYLISPPADTQSPVAPLLSAFTGELYHAAMLAHSQRKLDPHLTMLLDEVANICPVPLPEWSSYAAGSGIQLHSLGQSWAQFVARWGAEGANNIWQNHKTKMLWPTSDDPQTMERIAALGRVTLDPKKAGEDTDGKRPYEREGQALSDPGTQVPNGHVIVRLRGKRPTLVKARVHWKDPRSKMELPQLPPVTRRYVPSPMPELRHQVHEEGEVLVGSGSGSGSGQSAEDERDPRAAPALRRPSQSQDRQQTRPSLTRWNPAAAAEEDR